jgi:DNA-binding NarL/FixJ family response regulator
MGATSSALTAREREIAGLVAKGLTNDEIGRALHLSPTTIKWHVSQILRKLGLRSRVLLAVYAREHGLVPGAGGRPDSAARA